MEIVIASRNLHKIRELRSMCKHLKHLDLFSLLNFPDYVSPEESGATLQEIATVKAEHAARALNRWVLADDSGLFVPALAGAPGVHSRRYACADATDSENRQKLINAMLGMEELERAAYLECCLVVASPEGTHKIVTAQCEGVIATAERGRSGFGYDSLFIKYEYDKTFAELGEATKNRISHRHKAYERLLPTLEALSP
jgi:XTP/dITP diphosphohydrolase